MNTKTTLFLIAFYALGLPCCQSALQVPVEPVRCRIELLITNTVRERDILPAGNVASTLPGPVLPHDKEYRGWLDGPQSSTPFLDSIADELGGRNGCLLKFIHGVQAILKEPKTRKLLVEQEETMGGKFYLNLTGRIYNVYGARNSHKPLVFSKLSVESDMDITVTADGSRSLMTTNGESAFDTHVEQIDWANANLLDSERKNTVNQSYETSKWRLVESSGASEAGVRYYSDCPFDRSSMRELLLAAMERMARRAGSTVRLQTTAFTSSSADDLDVVKKFVGPGWGSVIKLDPAEARKADFYDIEGNPVSLDKYISRGEIQIDSVNLIDVFNRSTGKDTGTFIRIRTMNTKASNGADLSVKYTQLAGSIHQWAKATRLWNAKRRVEDEQKGMNVKQMNKPAKPNASTWDGIWDEFFTGLIYVLFFIASVLWKLWKSRSTTTD